MYGKITGGKMVVEVDINHEKLYGPTILDSHGNKVYQHWLPCDQCGEMDTVKTSISSFICRTCADKIDFDNKFVG